MGIRTRSYIGGYPFAVERVGVNPTHAFVDMGYRGHGYEGSVQVHVDKRRRGKTARSLWR